MPTHPTVYASFRPHFTVYILHWLVCRNLTRRLCRHPPQRGGVCFPSFHLPQQISSRRDIIRFIGFHPSLTDLIARLCLAHPPYGLCLIPTSFYSLHSALVSMSQPHPSALPPPSPKGRGVFPFICRSRFHLVEISSDLLDFIRL